MLHVPAKTWQGLAFAGYGICLLVQLAMMVLAGTPLVPHINGQANWLAIGPLRLQPSEFTKIAVLLAAARLVTLPTANLRHPSWLLGTLALIGLPTVIIAKEDLGTALTFLPLTIGILILGGVALRVLTGLMVGGIGVIALGIAAMPKEGPKAYQWKRIQAWLEPDRFALTEGFQSIRALRSVGSGQFTGKGYGVGDQNLLGWVPEKHTDMIFAVVGEETGFVGSVGVVLCFLAFGLVGLWAAMSSRDRFGRVVIGGFTALVLGQATINLAVVLGLMPVTGVTLPFFSYGGSSLLGLYLGLGICLSCTTAKTHHFSRSHLD
jgi:rod shape determining protein RodA